jgi:hypothetical protein
MGVHPQENLALYFKHLELDFQDQLCTNFGIFHLLYIGLVMGIRKYFLIKLCFFGFYFGQFGTFI